MNIKNSFEHSFVNENYASMISFIHYIDSIRQHQQN